MEGMCSSSCIIVKRIQGMYSITVGNALRVEILPTMEQLDVHPREYHSRIHWTMTLQHTSTLIPPVRDTVGYLLFSKHNPLRSQRTAVTSINILKINAFLISMQASFDLVFIMI